MDKQLSLTIQFWKSKLKDKGLFEPGTIVQIELTVKYLEKLRIKEMATNERRTDKRS